MKNKILILAAAIGFVVILILMNIFLNSQNDLDTEIQMSGKEENAMEVLNVTSANFQEEVLNSDKTVLIDFYADWCGPCKMISPILEQVEKEEEVTIVKVNVDELQDLAMKYGVMTIPNLKLFEKGKIKKENVGLMSKDEVKNFIK